VKKLINDREIAERQSGSGESTLQVHYDTLREQLGIYNKAIGNATLAYFSNLIIIM
jgi:hypothetical protein